jgi:DNA-binding transcriptional LysR family regulator
MHPPFDIRQLAYFVKVAEEGQITRAAAKLHIAQPALSQTIAKLEAAVGVRLFDRHPRGISLTPAGEAFIEKARVAVRAAEEAVSIVGPWRRAEGSLVIGFTPSFHQIARPAIRRFVETHPGVEISVRQLHPGERLSNLRAGTVDVEMLLPPPTHEPDLIAVTVHSSPRFVLLSEDHALAREPSLVFEQISGETFPGRHPSVSEQWSHAAWMSDRRGCDPPVTEETPLTLDEVWALVYAGKAVCVLPEFMVRSVEGDGVRAVPLSDVEPLEVAMVRRRDDERPMVTELFEIAADLAGPPEQSGAGDGTNPEPPGAMRATRNPR